MRRATIPLALCAVVLTVAGHAQQPPADRKAELDRLFESLKTAPDEHAASVLEGRIRTLWVHQGSPAAVLLLGRGDRDLQGGAGNDAIADYDAAITLEPDYTEAFNRRAAARAELGDYAAALADIEQVLKREPRHFSALQGLSHLAEERGDWKGALAAWQKALEIDPHTQGAVKRLEMLRNKAFGQAT